MKRAELLVKTGLEDQEELDGVLRSCGLNKQSTFSSSDLDLVRSFCKKLFSKKDEKNSETSGVKNVLHCSRCDQDKPEDEFYKNEKLSRGYEAYCKECKKEYQRIKQKEKKQQVEDLDEDTQHDKDNLSEEIEDRDDFFEKGNVYLVLNANLIHYQTNDKLKAYKEAKDLAKEIPNEKVFVVQQVAEFEAVFEIKMKEVGV